MQRETIDISDRAQWLALRAKDITSTEVSALFGINPWFSKFQLWHRKRVGLIEEVEFNERMKWGTRLEEVIARGIGEDHGFPVSPFKSYMRIPELKAGSSFDFLAGAESESLLEIKNVDSWQFKDKWAVEDGEVVEAPAHIEMQVQHQLWVSGKKHAYIGALVGGNSVSILKREPDEKIINKIELKIKEFWKSIESNTPPAPDFSVDSKFIQQLYSNAEPGKIIEDDSKELFMLTDAYRNASEDARRADELKDAIKAKILMRIGDAEKVKGDLFSISAPVVKGGPVSFEKKDFRMFRVYFKKEK